MVTAIDAQGWVMVVQRMREVVAAQSGRLSALDSTVGDGDHGTALAAALESAARRVVSLKAPTPQSVLQAAGSVIQDTMGGAAGALFGAFFLGAAQTMAGQTATALPEAAALVAGGLAEVQKRGKALPGDKTMVDALAPAAAALRAAVEAGRPLCEGLEHAATAAERGAEATAALVARHGRARFLGERSRGHQDAGATSAAMLLRALAEAVTLVDMDGPTLTGR